VTRFAALSGAIRASSRPASVANLKRSGTTVAPLPSSVQKKLYDLHREILSEQAGKSETLRALVAIVEGLPSSTVAANIK
jgi:hypothetical protein